VLFGTMETWLTWQLTGGVDGGTHLTDVTNASRTMLMDLRTLDWDDELCDAFEVPRAMLPQVRPSAAVHGTAVTVLPGATIGAAMGDQQAALFGQACYEPGEAKCTYGTGAFLLLNTGAEPVRSTHGLATTVAYQVGDQAPVYALEGSIAMTGSLVQWFRDGWRWCAPPLRSRPSRARSTTTAAATSSRRSRACSRRTGDPTRAG
jgi:glycerol kinase